MPPHLHKAIIKKCAAKNLHILCEKPLAHNIDDAQIIKHQLQYKEIVYMPCHQYKYAPVWKLFNEYAKKINDTKMYLQFDVIRLKADSGFDSSNPNWRTNNGAISGGGITVDTGAHYFYLILEMLGLPKSVFANMTRLKHFEYRVEDTSLVQITSEKGIAQVNLTWAGNKRFNSASLVSSSASLFYDGKEIKVLDGDGERTIAVPDMSDKKTYISLFTELFSEFENRISTKNYSNDLLIESTNAMQILDLCKKSNKTKSTLAFK